MAEPNGLKDEARQFLLDHPDVIDAAVWQEDGRLVACVVPDLFASATELRELLARWLDGRAEPAVAVVPALPEELPSLDELAQRHGLSVYAPPSTDVEAALCALWAEAVGTARASVDDDFLDLGADSLIAVQIQTAILDRWGVDIPLDQLFELSTPRQVAAHIAAASPGEARRSG